MHLLDSLELIVLAVLTASLSLCFYHFLEPGMIFNWYALFLRRLRYGKEPKAIKGVLVENKFWAYLVKPLGLCPYCNGTWIAIGVYTYIYFYSFNLILLLLLIGVNWLFIKIGMKLFF